MSLTDRRPTDDQLEAENAAMRAALCALWDVTIVGHIGRDPERERCRYQVGHSIVEHVVIGHTLFPTVADFVELIRRAAPTDETTPRTCPCCGIAWESTDLRRHPTKPLPWWRCSDCGCEWSQRMRAADDV